jgi:astacin
VEQRVSKTFQLKKALLKDAGLEGKVEPANNGVFQADLLLTEEQAAALIAELERQRAQKARASGRAKRAGNAIFMENSPTQRWPLGQPILYMFDQSLGKKIWAKICKYFK